MSQSHYRCTNEHFQLRNAHTTYPTLPLHYFDKKNTETPFSFSFLITVPSGQVTGGAAHMTAFPRESSLLAFATLFVIISFFAFYPPSVFQFYSQLLADSFVSVVSVSALCPRRPSILWRFSADRRNRFSPPSKVVSPRRNPLRDFSVSWFFLGQRRLCSEVLG